MRFHLEPTKKALIALGVACLASIGLAVFVHLRQSQQRVEWKARLAAKQKEAEETELAALSLPDTLRELEDTRRRLGILKDTGPGDYQPALLQAMTSLAQGCQVRVLFFTPVEPATNAPSPMARTKDVAPHRFLSVSTGVEGTFHNVARLLYRLAGLEKIIALESVQIQPDPDGTANRVRATLQMTAYIVKPIQPKTLAAAAVLKDLAEAEESLKVKAKEYGNLTALHAAGLTRVTEGDKMAAEGYTFTTSPSTKPTLFKILATATEPGLHDLSIDKSGEVRDETDGVLLK